MKKTAFLALFLLICLGLHAHQVSILSWNIQDLGRTKDAEELAIMVQIMREYDIVLIQEVVAKDPAGAQKVAYLADELDRTGANWDYQISDPTQSPSPENISPYMRERYAFLWNTSKVKLKKKAFLDQEIAHLCYREPFIAEFQLKKDTASFFVINYHARKYYDKPEEEIAYFDGYPARLQSERVLIAGDFNLDNRHKVWRSLKGKGFEAVLDRVPTTLKRACKGKNYLNHAIDNIFYPTAYFRLIEAESIDFVDGCENLEKMRGVSDHLPVVGVFEW